jgi:LacI family transcriptional regulator
MAKKVKIKEIAEMAGVSAGTVDRILHNRGKVSAQSREAVEKVLAEVGYKYNIHLSAMSFRKELNIHICIPMANSGEYWGTVKDGLEQALEEYHDINIRPHYFFYNQYDVYSCRDAYQQVGAEGADRQTEIQLRDDLRAQRAVVRVRHGGEHEPHGCVRDGLGVEGAG